MIININDKNNNEMNIKEYLNYIKINFLVIKGNKKLN